MIHDQYQEGAGDSPRPRTSGSRIRPRIFWSYCPACRNVGVCGVELVQARARPPEPPPPRQDRNPQPKKTQEARSCSRSRFGPAPLNMLRMELGQNMKQKCFSLLCRFDGPVGKRPGQERLLQQRRLHRYHLLTHVHTFTLLLFSIRKRQSSHVCIKIAVATFFFICVLTHN